MRSSLIACALALGLATIAAVPSGEASSPVAEVAITNFGTYSLRYRNDGNATFVGNIKGRYGRYVATVDFAVIDSIVSTSGLCERDGLGLYVEPRLKMPSMLLQLNCAQAHDKLFNDTVLAELPSIENALLKAGKDLDWRYIGPSHRP